MQDLVGVAEACVELISHLQNSKLQNLIPLSFSAREPLVHISVQECGVHFQRLQLITMCEHVRETLASMKHQQTHQGFLPWEIQIHKTLGDQALPTP